MHPLLERQLRKAFGSERPTGEAFARLSNAVDEAYRAADEDRALLERSLAMASEELYERNRRLELELEERRRLEIELRQAEKLRAVGQLAAGIAHEINTPIQYVGDSLHFLIEACTDHARLLDAHERVLASAAETAADAVNDARAVEEEVDLGYLRVEVPRALQRCLDGTVRVANIVRAFKSFAHPDTRAPMAADLNAALRNTIEVARNEIKHAADVELSLAELPHVVCHVGDIQQVFLNLLVNAAHAAAERHGESTRGRIVVTTRVDGADVVVSVADDGTGIAPEIRDRLFEPFFTTKAVGRGTGQGLSISRSLVVDRHGGQLSFDSTVGVGSTFVVRLPIAGRPRATSTRPTAGEVPA